MKTFTQSIMKSGHQVESVRRFGASSTTTKNVHPAPLIHNQTSDHDILNDQI